MASNRIVYVILYRESGMNEGKPVECGTLADRAHAYNLRAALAAQAARLGAATRYEVREVEVANANG